MTKAKQQRLACELATHVRYLRLTGVGGTALVAAMFGRMAGFRAFLTEKASRQVTCYERRRHWRRSGAAVKARPDAFGGGQIGDHLHVDALAIRCPVRS